MKGVTTDITTVTGPAIIAHGVNCQNKMGSGVAKAIYTKWPNVKTRYHEFKDKRLGFIQPVAVAPDLIVINCFTQEYYGQDGKKYASIEAIDNCLFNSVQVAFMFGIDRIHIPKIGCGLGGLDWETELVPALVLLEKEEDIKFIVHAPR